MTNHSICREISEYEERAWVYHTYMKEDFSSDELKPFSMIEESIARGECIFYGFFQEGMLLGYAIVITLQWREKKHCLLDYFAVVKQMRGRGIGSAFLIQLQSCIKEGMVLCEAENPKYAKSEIEQNDRLRRIRFYEQNGFDQRNITAYLYGVEYVLLIYSNNTEYSDAEIKGFYAHVYQHILPPKRLKKHFWIHETEDGVLDGLT